MPFVAGTGSPSGALGSLPNNPLEGFGVFPVAEAVSAGVAGLAVVNLKQTSPYGWAAFSRYAGDGSGSGVWVQSQTTADANYAFNVSGLEHIGAAVDGSDAFNVLSVKDFISGADRYWQVRLATWSALSASPTLVAGPFNLGQASTSYARLYLARRSDDSYLVLYAGHTETVGGTAYRRARLAIINSAHTTATEYSVWNGSTTMSPESGLAAQDAVVGLYVDPATDRAWICWNNGTKLFVRTLDSGNAWGAFNTSGTLTHDGMGEGAVVARSGATVLALPYRVNTTTLGVAYFADDGTTTAPVATESFASTTGTIALPSSGYNAYALAAASTAQSTDALAVVYRETETVGSARVLKQNRRTSAGWGTPATWKDDGSGSTQEYDRVHLRWIAGADNVGAIFQRSFSGGGTYFDYLSDTPPSQVRAWGWIVS